MKKNIRILIVSSDRETRKTLTDTLKSNNYLPLTAASGKTALSRASKEAPDLILIDLKLLDMSGFDLISEIKSICYNIEIIVVTSQTSHEEFINAVNLGASGIFIKPYNISDLLITVDRVIAKNHNLRELKDSEELYRMLFKTARDAIFINRVNMLGVPGRFIEINDAACKMFGYSREEFLTMTPLNLTHSGERIKIPENLRQLAGDGKIRIEIDGRTKAGSRLPLEISIHNFKSSGQIYGLSIVRDISIKNFAYFLVTDQDRITALMNILECRFIHYFQKMNR